ncbi:CobW family GTP-binding protein [Desertibaculum subflavum]|uniref:CobW family GTP-binding protein n=1 Tax=Desertibaculum subflavum TaxID=2268458 RepID=UPI000E6611B8
MIPVSVLTGFLGSGKTTLLAHLLRHPALARTAVIINEFGEIGLDHDLIETSDESFVELTTGCLCCTVRGDLVRTLGELLSRRDAGSIAPFERVVIETTGLADPAPILHALMTDPVLSDRLALAGVVTTVDAFHAFDTLARHPAAVKQVAMADRLVLTKGDLVEGEPAELKAELCRLNPAAPLVPVVHGAAAPELILDSGLYDAGSKAPDVARWLAAEAHGHGHAAHDHHEDIVSFCVYREAPIHAVALALFLETLAEHAGADLLRVKGILNIVESPERPAVIHGVQHVFHPPAWLDRWPSADRRSRLVFITRGIPRSWIERLLDLLEHEVAERSGEPLRQGEPAA